MIIEDYVRDGVLTINYPMMELVFPFQETLNNAVVNIVGYIKHEHLVGVNYTFSSLSDALMFDKLVDELIEQDVYLSRLSVSDEDKFLTYNPLYVPRLKTIVIIKLKEYLKFNTGLEFLSIVMYIWVMDINGILDTLMDHPHLKMLLFYGDYGDEDLDPLYLKHVVSSIDNLELIRIKKYMKTSTDPRMGSLLRMKISPLEMELMIIMKDTRMKLKGERLYWDIRFDDDDQTLQIIKLLNSQRDEDLEGFDFSVEIGGAVDDETVVRILNFFMMKHLHLRELAIKGLQLKNRGMTILINTVAQYYRIHSFLIKTTNFTNDDLEKLVSKMGHDTKVSEILFGGGLPLYDDKERMTESICEMYRHPSITRVVFNAEGFQPTQMERILEAMDRGIEKKVVVYKNKLGESRGVMRV